MNQSCAICKGQNQSSKQLDANTKASGRLKITCPRFQWESEAPAELVFGSAGASPPLPPGINISAARLTAKGSSFLQGFCSYSSFFEHLCR